MEQKTQDYLKSQDPEHYKLGLEICRTQHPAIWAALLNFTGYDNIDDTSIELVSSNTHINIGSRVRYRGMMNPIMTVTKMEIRNQKIVGNKVGYYTVIWCKYFNKSSQSFIETNDRIECFILVDDGDHDKD